jgi:protein-S-isoprenylcysteine O-methyltransferase Ste14
VIDTGPYAYIRHPGYVGFAVGWILPTPLLLASTGAFIPALIVVGLLVIRTAFEDRTLHAELPGYAEYATRVRFRLIPGVW